MVMKKKETYRIAGMSCVACASNAEKVLNRQAGVSAIVNFATETATIEYDTELCSEEKLIEVVYNAGFNLSKNISETEKNSSDKKKL